MLQKNKNYVNLSWLVYLIMGIIGFFLVRFFFDELNLATVYDLDISIYNSIHVLNQRRICFYYLFSLFLKNKD